MNYKNIKTWIYVPVILIFTLIVVFYWRDILMFFQYILEIFNISSRNITKMLNNESSEIGFRALIYEQAKQYLNTNNYLPLGLFGDRYILRQIWPELVYVHSLTLELLMSFGPIITFFVIGYISIYILRGLFVKDLNKKNASLLFCLVILPRLIVSGSFIVEGYFYLMLGVLRSLKASKKY